MLKKALQNSYLGLIVLFLYAPILTLIVLSFNASKSRAVWGGFTLDWYAQMFDSATIMEALYNTLHLAFTSSIIATVIGVMACIGIQAMSRRQRNLSISINNIPLMNADIVTGLALLITYVAFGVTLGYNTVLLAHITFNIPYVILSVMPKLKQSSRSTYEAALDLGATPLRAFFKVVFPDLVPGILSGFLLAFSMSLDDFIITQFTKGRGFNTLSTLIYSEVKRGVKPTMYALSTLLFVAVIGLLLISNFLPKKWGNRENPEEIPPKEPVQEQDSSTY